MVPNKFKRNVAKHFFQPTSDRWIIDKIVRKSMNIYYSSMDDAERNSFYQDLWGGEAGTSWTDFKRAKYSKGEMGIFLTKIRQPFVKMVIDFLKKNKDYKLILDTGTGPGELIFELFNILGIGYKFIGIDLNNFSIKRNIEKAGEMGFSKNIDFECMEASKWLESKTYIDNILVLSVATLKFFPKTQLEMFLTLIKRRCRKAAIALCEEVFYDYPKSKDSLYIDNLSFAHNYEELFKKIGYKINTIEIRQNDQNAPYINHLYAIASY